jgi:DNA polymerase-1
VKKLLLVDGNSLINRAFYATTLTNGATYGFLNMFLREIQDVAPTHVAVAFDVRAKTFRHQMFDGYKVHRKPMPDDLARQLFDLKDLLAIMGVKMFEKAGFEADDIIGTLATLAGKHGFHTLILTSDRDLLQLVTDTTEVCLTKVGVSKTEIWDTTRIAKEYGVVPKQLVDIKALMGDKSDNIPGAPGIGEKTAVKLIKEFVNVVAAVDAIEKLHEHRDIILKSRDLAQIKCDIEMPFDVDALAFTLPLDKPVFDAFKSRGFSSLCNRADLFKNTNIPVQQSFF